MARVAAGVQGRYPFACGKAKPVERDSTLVRGQVVQAAQAGLEKRACAAPIAALVMMKCRRNLDNSLKKSLFCTGGSEPNFFPGFMGLKEAFRIELFQSLAETPLIFRIHESALFNRNGGAILHFFRPKLNYPKIIFVFGIQPSRPMGLSASPGAQTLKHAHRRSFPTGRFLG